MPPEPRFRRGNPESGGITCGTSPGRKIFENSTTALDIRCDNLHIHGRGLVAELADAMDSKSIAENPQDIAGQAVTNTPDSAVPASVPVGLPVDPDLASIAAAWPTLPAALKAGILAMVKAANG